VTFPIRSVSAAGLSLMLLLLMVPSACAGRGDIQPGVGAAGIRLGDGRNAVEKVLGRPESTNTSAVHGSRNVETTYLLYPSKGLDVLLEGDKVRSIFLYSEGVDEHKKYPGSGPAGITLGSTRKDIAAALGEPSARGLGAEAELWYRYDAGLEVTFQSDGAIQHLVVTRPH